MISVKIDKSLKEAAQKTAADFGLPLGTMINSLLRQVVRDKKFTLDASEKPSALLRQAITEGERELSVSRPSKGVSMKKMFEKLDA